MIKSCKVGNIKYVVKEVVLDNEGAYTRIRRWKGKNYLDFWLETFERSGEVITEWNQYIFDLTNNEDLLRRDLQDDCDEFENMSSMAEENLSAIGAIEYTENGSRFVKSKAN